jgi:MtN3 and saliva related transmembrane protein
MTGTGFQSATEVVGVAAGLCSMGGFVPQLVKLIHARRADGVSLSAYLVMVAGFSLWVAYGVMLKSWPLTGSNMVNLGLAAWILILKCRIQAREKAAANAG